MAKPQSNKGPRLVLGVPSQQTWEAQFGASFVQLCLRLAAVGIPFRFHNARGSILPTLRSNIVDSGFKEEATHVLFLDSDQTFPDFVAERLLLARKDIVGCNIATKQFPSTPTARKAVPGKVGGEPVYTTDQSPEYQRVDWLGFGVILVSMAVFRRVPQPWFPMVWRPEIEKYQGEDWSFCEAAKKAGFQIWVDHHLSLRIGHLGKVEYTHEMVPVPEEEYSVQAAG